MAARGGAIVNITSVHGFAGVPGFTAYAATKGAINAFTRQLAIDLADRHIRVNAVGPDLRRRGNHRADGVPLEEEGRAAEMRRARDGWHDTHDGEDQARPPRANS